MTETMYDKVLHNGVELTLEQNAYLSGTNENPFYEAYAVDDCKNEYRVKWAIIPEYANHEDASEHCDWDDYTVDKI